MALTYDQIKARINTEIAHLQQIVADMGDVIIPDPTPDPIPDPVPPGSINLGSFAFDGSRHVVDPFPPNTVAYAKLAIGSSTGVTSLSVFEFSGPAAVRTVWLSNTPASAIPPPGNPYVQIASGINFYMAIGQTPPAGYVYLDPTKPWYLNIKNQKKDGTPSWPTSAPCAIKVYPINP